MYVMHQWNGDEYVSKTVDMIAGLMSDTITKNGSCILGLSGGSTPGQVYTELGKRNDIDWQNVKIFLIDERYIAADDERSNLHMIRSTLLSPKKIPEANITHPDTSLSINECVSNYDAALKILLRDHAVDIAILGLGEDGHTASLFPGDTSAIGETEKFAIHTTTDFFEIRDRITVTIPLLKNVRHPLLLIKGKNKLDVLKAMESSTEDMHRWPLKAIGDITVIAQEN